MNATKVRLIGALIIPAMLAVVWLVLQPRGSWNGLFVFQSAIAASCSFGVFFAGGVGRSMCAPLAFLFFFGAIASANWGSLDEQALDNLNAHFPAYVSNLETIEERRDPYRMDSAPTWRIRTPDTIRQVLDFHTDRANFAGLVPDERSSTREMLVFTNDWKTVTIDLSRSSGITEIIYRVSESDPNRECGYTNFHGYD